MVSKREFFSFTVICILAVLIAGCGGPSFVRDTDDPDIDEAALSRKLDRKDVDRSVDKLMGLFKTSPFIEEIKAGGDRPGIAVDIITNETHEHNIGTDLMLDSFETKVVNLRAFSVVNRNKTEEFKAALREQNSDWFNGATVANAGNLYGFRFIIGGKLFEIQERTSDTIRSQYRLILKVMNVETGVTEWQEKADVTKAQD